MAKLDFSTWVSNRRADLVSWVKDNTELVAVNVQTALEELALRSFETYFKLRSASSEGVSSTTSDNWVDKINSTQPDIPAGTYLCFAFCELANSSKNRTVGMRAEINGNEVTDSRDGEPVANTYSTRMAFGLFSLNAGPVNLTMQYGQTNSGGTANIRKARMFAFRVA